MIKKLEKISSGCTIFDCALSGGYPCGRIINIVGDSSAGKTLLSIELIAAAKRKYGKKLKWFYDDVEARFDYDTKSMYGFDILSDEDREKSSDTIEDFELNFQKQIKKVKDNEYFIYVLDSFDFLTSEAAQDRYEKRLKNTENGTKDKGSFKLEKTTEFGEFFRIKKKEIRDKKCLFIVISQVRQNIGVMFGEKYYRTGGKALDHCASQIIWLSETEKVKVTCRKQTRVVGITTKARVKKNSIGKPFRECFININFECPFGIDDVSTNIDYLYRLKTDTGKLNKESKGKLKWDKKEFTKEELIYYIEKNNLEDELIKRVQDDWKAVELAICQKNRKGKF